MALRWLSPGKRGTRYPPWLRELDGKSGAYAIRDASTREVLYVGESHTGRLYGTITRHFQWWTRQKQWWGDFFGQNDPGVVLDRDSAELAFRIATKDKARPLQAVLIRRLKPSRNVLEVNEDPPF